jgi:hypothetical protein
MRGCAAGKVSGMPSPYIEVELTYKQVALVLSALEGKVQAFNKEIARIERETGEPWEGGDIDEWDSNDIGVLQITVEQLKSLLASSRDKT